METPDHRAPSDLLKRKTPAKLRSEGDIPRIRLHDLRHTHATILLPQNVHPKVVSERLGHSSVAFTMTVYQHVMPGLQAQAASTFEAAVFGSSEGLLVTPLPSHDR